MSRTTTIPDVCPRITKIFVVGLDADREKFGQAMDELLKLRFRPSVYEYYYEQQKSGGKKANGGKLTVETGSHYWGLMRLGTPMLPEEIRNKRYMLEDVLKNARRVREVRDAEILKGKKPAISFEEAVLRKIKAKGAALHDVDHVRGEEYSD